MYFPHSQIPPQSVTDSTASVRTMQIIVGALILGVLSFVGVALFIKFPKLVPAPPVPGVAQFPVIAYFAMGMAAILFAARLVVPSIITQQLVRQLLQNKPTDQLTKNEFYSVYQTGLIIATALLEGAAFFNILAYVLQEQLWSLGVAGGLVVAMAAGFPTAERVDEWAADQLRQIQLNPPVQ